MDRRVLAHLEAGEVEPKRPDLPDEVLRLAPRRPCKTDLEQRLLELDELGDQLVGRGVARRRRPTALTEEPHAGMSEALGDESEALPEGFVGIALSEGCGQLGHSELVSD